MAKNLELITYIYNNLQQGYPLDSIKNQLKTQGFSEKEINQSVDFVYANYFHQDNATMKKNYPDYQTPKGKKVGVNEIAILVIIIFGVALIGFALVFILSSGGDIVIQNPDANKPEVVQPENPTEVIIPEKETPVVEKPTIPEVTPTTPTNTNSDVIAKLTDPLQGKPIEDPYDETERYTDRQIELKVDYFKQSNPSEALRFCEMYSEIKRNYCIIEVGVAAERVEYCEKITKDSTKDDCYLENILNDQGDLLTCESISNSYKKNTCKTLITMRTQTINQGLSGNDPADAINYGDIIVDIT